MQLFLDLDGVLVNFDGHYEATVGPLPDRNDPSRDIDWSAVNGIEFFNTAPPMPDAFELFDYVKGYNPIILTGAPSTGFEKAAQNKKEWVLRHLGPHVTVLCVKSKEKSHLCKPGDILVDDWEKYKDLWLAKGGRWVTHTSAAKTIGELKGMGL